MTTVILGAAGATGKAIASTLSAAGTKLRLVGRSEGRLRTAFAHLPTAELVAADLATPAGAARACQGADTAIMTLGLPYTQFAEYPALMRGLVQAACAAKIRRFMLVTNIYPYGLPQTHHVTEDHPREPVSFKGRMRKEQEDILLGANAQLRPLVLRLPDFFGPGAQLSYAQMIFDAALARKTVNLFAPADTPHQFVYVPDVGPVAEKLLHCDAAWGQVVHFAGSGETTVATFASAVYEAAGVAPRIRYAGKNMLRFMGVFSPMMREFVEMHYLQSSPVNLDDSRLQQLVGPVQRTSYKEGISTTLIELRKLALSA